MILAHNPVVSIPVLQDKSLPPPDAAGIQRSAALADVIRSEIDRNGGAIPFTRFMELALYTPRLGYYVSGAHKFGRGGDFVTAPGLGELFARCLARQCAQLIENGHRRVLEVGAGVGDMAAVLLEELARLDRVPDEYAILEISPDLVARQHDALESKVPGFTRKVRWLDRLPEPGFRGVVLANEVLDAMPVARFRVRGDALNEMYVTWDDDRGFIEVERSVPVARPADLPAQLPEGYTSETHPHATAWLRTVAERMESGAIFVVDYGFPAREYYHPQRHDGTLMCHYRHRAHADPYRMVGLQDITAHLDFTALADAARDSGLEVLGYAAQGPFLMSLGLLDMVPVSSESGDVRAQLAATGQIKKLTLPHEMGELFKVLAVGRGIAFPLAGFSLLNHRDRL